jgi:hypothetical protein
MSLLALLMAATPATPPSISLLSGYWLSCSEGVEISETWSDLRSGMLLGTSITVKRSGKLSWESARIAPSDEGYVFFANPSGQAPTRFRLKSADSDELVFENLEHDFPQRLIYRRDKDMLHARIEGMVEGKLEGESWSYRAAPLNSRCEG